MTDTRFAGVGLSRADATALRERFAGWPRDAEATDRQLPARNAARPQPGPGTARAVAGVSRVRMTLTRPGHNSGPNRTAPLKPTGTTRRPSHDLTGPQRLQAVNHHKRINVLLPDGPLTGTKLGDTTMLGARGLPGTASVRDARPFQDRFGV
jgi:hypothetical protein